MLIILTTSHPLSSTPFSSSRFNGSWHPRCSIAALLCLFLSPSIPDFSFVFSFYLSLLINIFSPPPSFLHSLFPCHLPYFSTCLFSRLLSFARARATLNPLRNPCQFFEQSPNIDDQRRDQRDGRRDDQRDDQSRKLDSNVDFFLLIKADSNVTHWLPAAVKPWRNRSGIAVPPRPDGN